MSERLWQLERAFWTGAAAEAIRHLHPAAVMILAPTGLIRGKALAATLTSAPRWDSVTMNGEAVETDGITVLAYDALARRGGDSYQALCSSAWVRVAGGWRLLSHQQTPPL